MVTTIDKVETCLYTTDEMWNENIKYFSDVVQYNEKQCEWLYNLHKKKKKHFSSKPDHYRNRPPSRQQIKKYKNLISIIKVKSMQDLPTTNKQQNKTTTLQIIN